MTSKRPPKPPAHLRAATKRWWTWVMESFEMEQHHARVLTAAAETWDRAQEAREEITKRGAFFEDRFGAPKAHPAVAVERDAKIRFARLLRELKLDIDGPESRPPGLGGG